MPRPAEIRFIRNEGQDSNHRACRNHEAILLPKAARQHNRRQAPDQPPCRPVERPREFRASRSNALPPPVGHQRPKLQVDSQINADPQARFHERISILQVIVAVAGAYRGYTRQTRCVEQRNQHTLRRRETRSSSPPEKQRRSWPRQMHTKARSAARSTATRLRLRPEPQTGLSPASANSCRH